jgi:hypothetical protein
LSQTGLHFVTQPFQTGERRSPLSNEILQRLKPAELGGLKRSSLLFPGGNPVLESRLELSSLDGISNVWIGQQIVLLREVFFREGLLGVFLRAVKGRRAEELNGARPSQNASVSGIDLSLNACKKLFRFDRYKIDSARHSREDYVV